MSGACAALVASVVLGAGGWRYDVGATTQVSYTSDWATLAPIRTAQLELVPRLGLSYRERSLSFSLTYDPQLLTSGYWSFSVLHRAILSLDLRASREFRLAALANASYGTYDFRYQAANLPTASGTTPGATPPSPGGTEPPTPTTPPPSTLPPQTVQSVPILAKATYLQANAGLGLELRASRDLGVKAALAYLVQGGTDAASRLAVPYQRGPTGAAEVDWRLTPRHSMVTLLGGSYYDFPSEPPAVVGHTAWTSALLEAWRYAPSRTRRFQLGAGVGASGMATESGDFTSRDVAPVADALLELGGLRLAAGYRPSVDFTTGLAARRVDANASLSIPFSSRWNLTANAAAAEIVSGLQRGQITASGQVVASARLLSGLRAFAGLTGLWQRAGPDYPAAAIRQASLLVGVDYATGGRF